MNNKKPIYGGCAGLNKKMYLLGAVLAIVIVVIWLWGNNKSAKSVDPADQAAKDFNVQVSIPSENKGDISVVSPEKVDSLFDNLKQ